MTSSTQPLWHHTTDDTLILEIGHRRAPVPEPVADWLLDSGGTGLSTAPGNDLLRLERRLQRLAANLDAQRDNAAATIRTHAALLRRFVIDLQPPDGDLRDAADGWQRDSRVPASVVLFIDVEQFLDADPRRATTADWGGRTIAGIETFGLGWRRDGDDERQGYNDHDDEVALPGPWQIGHIRRNGDIYAIRRGTSLPQQVWLLGTGFDTHDDVCDVLFPVMPRMRTPNSLILAAHAAHEAQLRRATSRSGVGDPDSKQTNYGRMSHER
ncbi:hypothetical protein GCM10027436_43100 [Actinophytocola sediminis]